MKTMKSMKSTIGTKSMKNKQDEKRGGEGL